MIMEIEGDLATVVTYRAAKATLHTWRRRRALRCIWWVSSIIGSQLKASTRRHIERMRDRLSPYGEVVSRSRGVR